MCALRSASDAKSSLPAGDTGRMTFASTSALSAGASTSIAPYTRVLASWLKLASRMTNVMVTSSVFTVTRSLVRSLVVVIVLSSVWWCRTIIIPH